MEQSSSCETNIQFSGTGITYFFRNKSFNHHTQKSYPLAAVLSPNQPTQLAHNISLRAVSIVFYHYRNLNILRVLFPTGLLTLTFYILLVFQRMQRDFFISSSLISLS